MLPSGIITNNLSTLAQKLVHTLNPNIHNPQKRMTMLTPRLLNMPLPPLRLLLNHHRPAITPQHAHTALKQPLVDQRATLQRKLTGAQRSRAVKAQHVAGLHIRHAERELQLVAGRHEVRACVQERGDVVVLLRVQERQRLEQRFADFQR